MVSNQIRGTIEKGPLPFALLCIGILQYKTHCKGGPLQIAFLLHFYLGKEAHSPPFPSLEKLLEKLKVLVIVPQVLRKDCSVHNNKLEIKED